MLFPIFLALFLLGVGLIALLVIYMCLLWLASDSLSSESLHELPTKHVSKEGLSASELDKLPKASGKELIIVTECAVCLEEIEDEEKARVLPDCKHGFHLQCVDTWLSRNSCCPLCRAELQLNKQICFSADDDGNSLGG